jgi:polyphosphate kinase 2 (PPK2 family)
MAKDKQQKHDVLETKAACSKMKRKEFEKELAKLQVELTRLQTWVQAKGARVIVVFEGRDTAGKGGVISRITARTSPRVYRHVALPAPSDREKTQVCVQRYIPHFPAAGESHSAWRETGRSPGAVSGEIRDGRERQDRQGARSCRSTIDSAAC